VSIAADTQIFCQPQIATELPRPDEWPEPPGPEAFAGIAGKFVEAVAPHIEADSVALLAQFLTAAGCAIGPGPHLTVGANRHEPRLFVVLVGSTSRSRKGSSLAWVRHVIETADPSFSERWRSGLSSGEGLIYAVRDEVTEWRPGKGETPGCYVVVDPGISDKRLFAAEGEYSRVLRVAEREGNVLSETLRLAWDGAPLETMTRSAPVRARKPYVAIVGHITVDELRRCLTEKAAANGYGNRHLWLAVRRSKLLPDGGSLRVDDLAPLAADVRECLRYARSLREVRRSPSCIEMWRAVYPSLTKDEPGLCGSLVARAEAQTLRLSLVYALLDMSETVEPRHLLSALSLWAYAERSARYIFGDSLGDPVADEILRALRRSPQGLTRTEVHNLFGRNLSAGRIAAALGSLRRYGLVEVVQDETHSRSIERWACVRRYEKNEFNE